MPDVCLFHIPHSTFINHPLLTIVLPYILSQLRGSKAPWESRESSRAETDLNLSCKCLGESFHLSKPQLYQR